MKLITITSTLVEKVFENYLSRLLLGIIILVRGSFYLFTFKNAYLGIRDYCWIYRVINIPVLNMLVYQKILSISKYCFENKNIIRNSFLKSSKIKKHRNRYSLGGKGELDIFRDVLVLKKSTNSEKGVIIIKYGETFEAFISYFDVEKIFEKYYIVLEMSWTGCCDPAYLNFITNKTIVVVCTPEKSDKEFVDSLNVNLKTIEIGSGDWINFLKFPISFQSKKCYDLVMLANWGTIKKHKILFKALKKLDYETKLTILLIGFPWQGRTKQDIEDEFKKTLKNKQDRYVLLCMENIAHNEICALLSKSKISLLLSKKEGHNKGIMESMFCGAPAIIYEKHKGGALEKINPSTGILSSYKNLHLAIKYMLAHYHEFDPHSYISSNSGSKISTQKLNDYLKRITVDQGFKWTCDIVEKSNNPNLEYTNPQYILNFKEDYEFIKKQFQ